MYSFLRARDDIIWKPGVKSIFLIEEAQTPPSQSPTPEGALHTYTHIYTPHTVPLQRAYWVWEKNRKNSNRDHTYLHRNIPYDYTINRERERKGKRERKIDWLINWLVVHHHFSLMCLGVVTFLWYLLWVLVGGGNLFFYVEFRIESIGWVPVGVLWWARYSSRRHYSN